MVWCSLSIVLILLAASLLSTIGTVRAGANSWTPVTLPAALNVTSIAVSPAFPCDNTVFFGTDGDGVFRTTDASLDAVWVPINTGLTDLGVLSIAISPGYNRCDRPLGGDATVFLSTRSGVFRSVDAGASWQSSSVGLPPSRAIQALAISPNFVSDRQVFAGIDGALFRSTDRGGSWLPLDAGLTDRTVQAFAPSANYANDGTLYVGTRFSGVYRWAARLTQATPTPTPTPAPTPTPTSGTAGAQERIVQQLNPFPSLKIVKIAGGGLDGETYYTVPGPVQFTYTVTNNGNSTITNIRVEDNLGTGLGCGDDPETTEVDENADDIIVGTIASLAPDQAATVGIPIVISPREESLEPGATFKPLRNNGCASGIAASTGLPVGAIDDAVVQLVTWQSITDPSLTDLWVTSFAISPFFANDQTIFAGSAFGGLFKSSNAATSEPTWTRVNPGLEPEWVWVRAIALSPRYPQDRTVFVGTEGGIFKGVEGTDGNVTWTSINAGLTHLDVRALAISPDFGRDHVAFAGVFGNDVYRLRDGGPSPTWEPQRRITSGLWTWAVELSQEGVVLAGSWGRGIARKVLPSGDDWSYPLLPGASNAEVTALAKSPGYCVGYALFAGTWAHGLFKSVNGGSTWSPVTLPSGTLPIRDVVISPAYDAGHTLLVATWGQGIFLSLDDGVTWTTMNAGLPDLRVRALAVTPNYPFDPTVYAGTDSAGVFRWDAASQKWIGINSGLTNLTVMTIAVSPQFSTDGTVLVGIWGGGIFRSQNRGDSWDSTSGGLGSSFVRALAFSPGYATDRKVYAGTHRGPFRSTDGGNSWQLLGTAGDELSFLDVTDFAFSVTLPRTVFASTGGRGIWQFTEMETIQALRALPAQFAYRAFIPMVSKTRGVPPC